MEVIYLPDAVETLLETYPERVTGAIDRGDLTLRSRDAFPYGLAIFDDRVGIGGFNEDTGTLQVFVDIDAAIARDWAVRVYELYRDDSETLNNWSNSSRPSTLSNLADIQNTDSTE